MYRYRLQLVYRPLFIPPTPALLELYESCATEKLFLPWALPELDKAIFLDTDIIFMRPPEDLIVRMQDFDNTQMLGVAPVDGYYVQGNIEVC